MDKALINQNHYDWIIRESGLLYESSYQIKKISTGELESTLAAYFGVRYALLTTSATMGLTLALRAVGAENKLTAIPAFTFIAPAFAAIHNNARIMFADISKESLCSELGDFTDADTLPNIIVTVHNGGACCDMGPLASFCAEHGIILIEDAAQAFGSTYQGKKLGTIGDIGVISFGRSKLISCGEGGLILTDNKEYADRMYALIRFGVSPGRAKYEHGLFGFNAKMSEVLASMINAQLPGADELIQRRCQNAVIMRKKLEVVESFACIEPVFSDLYNCYTFLMRYIPKHEKVSRDKLVLALRENGFPVTASEKFPFPVYRNPCFDMRESLCSKTEDIYKEILAIGHPAESCLFDLPAECVESAGEGIVNTVKGLGID